MALVASVVRATLRAMPRPVHEIPLVLLTEQPERLSALLEALGYAALPASVTVRDSLLRAQPPVGAPDLVLGDDGEPWTLLELQLDPDVAKEARWHLFVSLAADSAGRMCDLVVLTPSRAVAKWSHELRRTGPLGTVQVLRPVVILIGRTEAERLLKGPPELAAFAAWAVSHRYGRRAQEIVARALERVQELPERMRLRHEAAIIEMLNPALLRELTEPPVDLDDLISDKTRELVRTIEDGRRKGVLQGLAVAVLDLLRLRNIEVDSDAEARVLGCRDQEQLRDWHTRAFRVERAADLFEGSG
jgi:hypothetical protein